MRLSSVSTARENGFQGREGDVLPEMTDEVANNSTLRYCELYEHITGEKFILTDDNTDLSARIEKNISEYLDK